MPFKSAKQRRFMYANHPKIAKRWSVEEKLALARRKALLKQGKQRAATRQVPH
jgi:hypothetical protein